MNRFATLFSKNLASRRCRQVLAEIFAARSHSTDGADRIYRKVGPEGFEPS